MKKSSFLGKIYKIFDKTRCIAYIVFVLSFVFRIAFNQSMWNNEVSVEKINKLLSICELIRNKTILVLFILEVSEIAKRLFSFKKENVCYFLKLLGFIFFYLLMKRYAYYTRFEEFIVLLYFAKELSFKQIISLYLGVIIFSLLIQINGLNQGKLNMIEMGRGYAYGFPHSNSAAIFLIMLLFAVTCYTKKKWIILVLTFISFILTMYYMRSRTPTIILILFVLLLLTKEIFDFKMDKTRIIDVVFCLLPIFMFIISIVMCLAIINGLIRVDNNMSARFIDIFIAYRLKGLAPYYRDFLDVGFKIYFDNGYANLLFKHGYVAFGIFNILWIVNAVKIVLNKNHGLMVISTCLFVYMLMEFIILQSDFPLIVMTYMFAKSEEGNNWDKLDNFVKEKFGIYLKLDI